MTSSLVGSEMCIRDSLNSDAPGYVNLFRDGSFIGGLIAYGGPVPTGSVSYTHLTLPTICSV
eukprot:8149546-Prorocentrum_lima.AAC.1